MLILGQGKNWRWDNIRLLRCLRLKLLLLLLQVHRLKPLLKLLHLSRHRLLLTTPVSAVLLITSLLFPQLSPVSTLLSALHPLQSLCKETTVVLLHVERTSGRQSNSGLSPAAEPSSILTFNRIR